MIIFCKGAFLAFATASPELEGLGFGAVLWLETNPVRSYLPDVCGQVRNTLNNQYFEGAEGAGPPRCGGRLRLAAERGGGFSSGMRRAGEGGKERERKRRVADGSGRGRNWACGGAGQEGARLRALPGRGAPVLRRVRAPGATGGGGEGGRRERGGSGAARQRRRRRAGGGTSQPVPAPSRPGAPRLSPPWAAAPGRAGSGAPARGRGRAEGAVTPGGALPTRPAPAPAAEVAEVGVAAMSLARREP